MMTMVVPKLLAIVEKWDLPATTKLLIFFSNFISGSWYIIIIFIVAIMVFIYIWKKTSDWKYLFDSIILKIPVFWTINKKMVLSKFSRTFSWLSSSWVSVVESLKITAKALWNEVYKQRIMLLSKDITWWIKIWESIDWDSLFPDILVQMIQVWEETAKLDQTIVKVADFYDEELDNTISILNKLLEPFIIVTLAIVVWFIAVAIMQPIMNLADVVSEG
jgi:type IV pilus assembly protein PilC